MKTCTKCRFDGLTGKGYVPDADEDVRLVKVEYPAPRRYLNSTKRVWLCALHRKLYEEHGARVAR